MKKFLLGLLLIIIPINVFAIQIDKDVNSGIILSADENIVPTDTVLSVSNINNSTLQNLANSYKLTSYGSYNISVLNQAIRIKPNGNVSLSFPIANYNLKKIYVLQVEDSRVKTVYTNDISNGLANNLVVENNYATIITNDFSLSNDNTYIIGTINTETENPLTYDGNFTGLLLISGFAMVVLMILFTKLYIDNKD